MEQYDFILEGYDEKEAKDIVRNLNNLLSIPEGSVPLARGMGLSWDDVSKIPADLENDIVTDIVSKVDMYEPRVSVSAVDFEHAQDGQSRIKIYFEKGDGYDTGEP